MSPKKMSELSRDTKAGILLVMASILIISGCVKADNTDAPSEGALQGTISIGPLCPVERNPPDPACQPTEETFKEWQLAVYDADKGTKVRDIIPSSDGSFEMKLPPGNYKIDFTEDKPRMVTGGFPIKLEITSPLETKIVEIDIDTGIR